MNNIYNKIDKILDLVNKAIDLVYEKDYYLIRNIATERCIVFHFSKYLSNLLLESEFKDYNCDYEYNTDILSEEKYKKIVYDNEIHDIYPDVLVHKRGENDYNLLVIEFKKNKEYYRSDDMKLQCLTMQEGKYKYTLGLYINLNIKKGKRKHVSITKYFNGKKLIT